MIAKKSRLPTAEFRSGAYRTIRTPWFLLKAKRAPGSGLRAAVIVGKTVHKNATTRNFLKRQAKQVIAATAKTSPSDFLMIVSPKANQLTKKQFQAEVVKAVRAAKII